MKTLTQITALALLFATTMSANAQSVERTAGILASCSAHFEVMSQITANENGGEESRKAAIGYRKISEDMFRAAKRTGTPDLDSARTLGNANAMILINQKNWNGITDRARSCILTAKTGPVAVDGIVQTR